MRFVHWVAGGVVSCGWDAAGPADEAGFVAGSSPFFVRMAPAATEAAPGVSFGGALPALGLLALGLPALEPAAAVVAGTGR